MNTKFSNHIFYVNESGDFSLASINQDYPVFVLAFCVFDKDKYLLSDYAQQQQDIQKLRDQLKDILNEALNK